MYKVMIIEDDIKLRELVGQYLLKYGFEIIAIKDFTNIEEQFLKIDPHLVLLDINIPYYDGFYLCQAFRRKSKAPVIIISARSGVMDQVMGIELGADDYITKPFEQEVLLAKIKAAIRRAFGPYSTSQKEDTNVEGLTLDQGSFKLLFGSKEVELSKNEYKLFKIFLEKVNQVINREKLLAELWDDNVFVDENTLNVNIARVKGKLVELGVKNAIKTKRGIGYFLDSKEIKGD